MAKLQSTALQQHSRPPGGVKEKVEEDQNTENCNSPIAMK